jgi:glycosyltransferase involved in cell wall biosynthesis
VQPGSQLRRVVRHSLEAARSVTRAMPAPVRTRLRTVAEQADRLRPVPVPEEWSRPLTGAGSGSWPGDGPIGPQTPAPAAAAAPERAPSGQAIAADGRPARPPLRCLIVASDLDVGGMVEIVALLAARLPEFGIQTAVLQALPGGSRGGTPLGRTGQRLRSAGIEVHQAGESDAATWIRRWRPDVISAHYAPGWVLPIASELGAPYLDYIHSMDVLMWADWAAEAGRSAQVAGFVTGSELIRQGYLARNPAFPPERISAVPYGVPGERFAGGDRALVRERLGLTSEYLFVCLARHCPAKNTFGLVAAFAELAARRPEVHLMIAGKLDVEFARYHRHVRRLRDSLPCRDRVHLREHVPVPAELLAAADGFVLDSFYEGSPLVSMEALCAGVPVVLSEVGAAREQIGDDPARGFLVPNPLGDALAIDQEKIGAALYRRQANQDDLVAAMDRLVAGRDRYLASRAHLAAESVRRFSQDASIADHAAVLGAAARQAASAPQPAG